jgi:hypothetical protein
MKIRKRSRFAAEVATSSLNDIMFFLLLFFLTLSSLRSLLFDRSEPGFIGFTGFCYSGGDYLRKMCLYKRS